MPHTCVLAVMALLASGCGRSGAPEMAAAVAPPSAAVKRANARFAKLEEIRAEVESRRKAGRPLLLNFWATWCGPCVEELPALAVLAREWGAGGPEIIGVSLDAFVYPDEAEAEGKVQEILTKSHLEYSNFIYLGDQDTLLDAFAMPGSIPYSILYDKNGKAVARYEGEVTIAEVRAAAKNL